MFKCFSYKVYFIVFLFPSVQCAVSPPAHFAKDESIIRRWRGGDSEVTVKAVAVSVDVAGWTGESSATSCTLQASASRRYDHVHSTPSVHVGTEKKLKQLCVRNVSTLRCESVVRGNFTA